MRRTGLLACFLTVAVLAVIARAQDPAAEVLDEPVVTAEDTAPADAESADPEPAETELVEEAPEPTEPPAELDSDPADPVAVAVADADEIEIPAADDADEPDADEPEAADTEADSDAEEGGDAALEDDAEEVAPAGTDWGGLIQRAPKFIALTHHAAVHLPIALWLFGAFFVLVGVVFPSWRNQIPLACLIGGSLTSIAGVASGWWYAAYEYGDAWAWGDGFGDWSEHLVKHRWTGVALVLASLVLSVIALVSQARQSRGLGAFWRLGLIALALGVAWEGHLGGEMIHGEGFIEEAYEAWVHPEPE